MAPRRDGGVEALLDDLARRRANARWDVAICLTDLPLHTERVPLVAQAGRLGTGRAGKPRCRHPPGGRRA